MKIHVDPAIYGHEPSKILIELPSMRIADLAVFIRNLQSVFPDAEMSFDKTAIGAGLEDYIREQKVA